MSSRDRKKASVYRKLQRLRSVVNSTAVNKTSIIVDASRYIEELKEKMEVLNQETGTSGLCFLFGFQQNCPGLLVSILETFEELGLDVLDARVSCQENFQLEAIGGENQSNAEGIDAQMVKQAVMQAISKWSENI
ncbi:hypothetical protein ES332_A10G177600v1 [Gossypium tomentosum]|uniref:Plant bHLH transcription factor ACT-like domain-containing protein n=1 Tax=Gossypium tomentosum TaxID=34277 RepID=A0A5D2NUA9_GOSTO|nr:hypothetical protein ES332_A10G177600v1 [Gossypium tomentosum]